MEKYVLITGGELRNKGAQAMSFITIDQVRKRYPEHKIILFSNEDYKRTKKEKDNYRFEILPFPKTGEVISICTGFMKKRYLKSGNGENFARYKKIFKNADVLLDISGYALGSKWGSGVIISYLKRIYLAKYFRIPVYLMPQSFGPFDFKYKKSYFYHKAIKHYLSYVKLIMARENEGEAQLKDVYKLKNVIKTPDLVLQNKEICADNIYYIPPENKLLSVEKNSVAIIPNRKNNKFGNEEAILKMYQKMINVLLESGKQVYLLYHAIEDLDICRTIKKVFFKENQQVHLIEDELNCLQFDNIVSNFDFIVGSRYHSIVHSYRKSVPAVILGWAIKYKELAEQFQQSEYCFDATDDSSYDMILEKVKKMCNTFLEESEKISLGITEMQKESVYDLIKIQS